MEEWSGAGEATLPAGSTEALSVEGASRRVGTDAFISAETSSGGRDPPVDRVSPVGATDSVVTIRSSYPAVDPGSLSRRVSSSAHTTVSTSISPSLTVCRSTGYHRERS